VRKQRQKEVDNIRKLGVGQRRQYWKALFALGHMKTRDAQTIPAVAIDSAGVVHEGAAGAKDVWFDFWAGLASADGWTIPRVQCRRG
jgi:hypothetical protein